jgi:hypothetical protein
MDLTVKAPFPEPHLYFKKNKTAKTNVEKIKQPKAKLRSVFLEIVIMYLTSSP